MNKMNSRITENDAGIFRDSSLKRSMKFYQFRLEDFQNVAQLQTNLLLDCQSNIQKKYQQGATDVTFIQENKMSGDRIVRNLQKLLAEMDTLRTQIMETELGMFDKFIQNTRRDVFNSINNYKRFCEQLLSPKGSKFVKDESSENRKGTDDDEYYRQEQKMRLKYEDDLIFLQEQAEISESVETIEKDVIAINEMFCNISKAVDSQKESVSNIEDNMEVTNTNVKMAERQLAEALRKKIIRYPLYGALGGLFIGGPLGLLAGLKIGAVASITGGILGFSGGKLLKSKDEKIIREVTVEGNHLD